MQRVLSILSYCHYGVCAESAVQRVLSILSYYHYAMSAASAIQYYCYNAVSAESAIHS